MLPVRFKKLIGVAVILVWLPVYALLAMGVGLHILPHADGFERFAYYLVAGMAWIIPIGLMLPWMSRPPSDRLRSR